MGKADDGAWRVDPEISGGGHFVDLGSHTLDLLDWLLGPVTMQPESLRTAADATQPRTWSPVS